jgi:tetratricopeptide (TPR) repeat protein
MHQQLKNLLWLVRERLYIVKGKYQEAISYIETLPLGVLKATERRVFEGDAAEAVYGLIQKNYLNEDYAKSIKLWEQFKEKYETRVGVNSHMYFMIASAYIRVGLHTSFDRIMARLEKIPSEAMREYPLWITRQGHSNLKQIMEKLQLERLIATKEWELASAKLSTLEVSLRDTPPLMGLEALIAYAKNDYNQAIRSVEKIMLVKSETQTDKLTPREMAEVMSVYIESLYKIGDRKRFATVVKALRQDLKQSKSAPILNVAERVDYLLVEHLNQEEKPKWDEVALLCQEFLESYQKSPYIARIEYLLGLSKLRDGKIEQGKKILQGLSAKANIPGYVREMAKTELSTLELKNKQL